MTSVDGVDETHLKAHKGGRAYLEHLRKQPLATVYVTLDIANNLLQYPLPQDKPRVRAPHLLFPLLLRVPSTLAPLIALTLDPCSVFIQPHLPVLGGLGYVEVVRGPALGNEAVNEEVALGLVG